MNRWVLLEHKVFLENSEDIHYDFLIEDGKECLTWKFLQIPTLSEGPVEVLRQPNHRLVWLSRVEHELSEGRGFVKRIDHGIFVNVTLQSVSRDLKVILDGTVLNGLFVISGNFCRLCKNN